MNGDEMEAGVVEVKGDSHSMEAVDVHQRRKREGKDGSTDGRQDFHRFGHPLLASLGACVSLRFGHRPMGFRLFKLIVCLLLARPLASPGWGHTCFESPARAGAHLLEEWRGVMAENPVSGSFDLKVRCAYGQDLVKQDQVSSPPAADTSEYYAYDGLGSVRVLIEGSGQAWAFGHKYLYDAFSIFLNTPGNTPNNSGYTGEFWDQRKLGRMELVSNDLNNPGSGGRWHAGGVKLFELLYDKTYGH